MHTEVMTFLDRVGVPYAIKPHTADVFTCEDAARERGVRLSQIVKCMIGCSPERELHVMLIPGDKILKLKRVRQVAGGIRIDLLSPDALKSELGLVLGAISPTQLLGRAKFYLDHSLFREELVDISSGQPNAGVELKLEDLCSLLEPTRCDIISTSGES